MGVVAYYKRWRHSRGFGIHSPFAYRFITEVLCQPLAYYAYAHTGKDRNLRLIVRLLAFFRPERIMIASDDAGRYADIVKKIAPRARIVDRDADFLIADRRVELGGPVNAVFLGRQAVEWWQTECCGMPYGMSFSNGCSRTVCAALPHLPRQDFSLRF